MVLQVNQLDVIETWFILAVISPILMGSAGVFQKRGLDELPDLDMDWWAKGLGKIKEVILIVLNRYFIGGALIGVLGYVTYMVALSNPVSEISIVQPLQGVGNFMAVILGVLWLGEKLDKSEYVWIVILILGIIFLNISA